MLKRLYRRYRTRVPDRRGTWVRDADNTITDESLKRISYKPAVLENTGAVYRGSVNIGQIGTVHFSFFDNESMDDTLLYVRSIFHAVPKLDRIYRRFITTNLLVTAPIFAERSVTYSEFYAALSMTYIQVWYPNRHPNLGANVWYSTGNVYGGYRVCVVLGTDRRMHSVAAG
jgi:hypothetical protein